MYVSTPCIAVMCTHEVSDDHQIPMLFMYFTNCAESITLDRTMKDLGKGGS